MEKYNQEAKERWGDEKSFKEYESKNYSKKDTEQIKIEMDKFFFNFSNLLSTNPSSDVTQELVLAWKTYINERFYSCDNKLLLELAKMYLEDDRFKNNIDKYQEGTTEYMFESINIFCEKNK